MKSILMSRRPEQLVNILNGNATLLLSKSVPKDFKGWVYLHCSKAKPHLYKGANKAGHTLDKTNPFNYLWALNEQYFNSYDLQNGKIVARFWFDEYIELEYESLYINTYYWKNSLISNRELEKATCLDSCDIENYGKGKGLYAWHIKNLEIFDEPKELSEFKKWTKKLIDCGIDCPPYVDDVLVNVTKAPSNWMYVEVKM